MFLGKHKSHEGDTDQTTPYEPARHLATEWRPTVKFILELIAASLVTAGTILASPVVAAWVEGKSISALSFWIGMVLLIGGLVFIPILIRFIQMRANKSGCSSRFVERIDSCLQAINEYRSEVGREPSKGASQTAVVKLVDIIAKEAVSILGNQARVCVYRYSSCFYEESHGKSQLNSRFYLEAEAGGGGRAHASARDAFTHDDAAGSQFLKVVRDEGTRVVVNDVKNPPIIFGAVKPNFRNGYNSFVVSPIRTPKDSNGARVVIGAITVDFPKKNAISAEVDRIVHSITEMFSLTYFDVFEKEFSGATDFRAYQSDYLEQIHDGKIAPVGRSK